MGSPGTDRDDLLNRIRSAFIARDGRYKELRKKYDTQCKELQNRLAEREKKDIPTTCSRQMLGDASWLVHYTCEWDRIERQIAKVEASLDKDQTHAQNQDADGSWGACVDEWYRKLEPTVDKLQVPGCDPTSIKPLEFLAPLTNTARVMGNLWRLQISDIKATGINYRDELGATQTALAQLLFKDQLHDLLEKNNLGFRFKPGFEAAFCDYLAQTQHPRTGYWGPWYLLDGELVMAHDLSFTFHVVNFRRGNIANWPLVIDTTLGIKNDLYPYGWKPNAETQYSHHNDYDVAQILAYGWSYMNWNQRERARTEILAMLTWCLTDAIDADGAFIVGSGDVPVETYYFGVRFLDAIGFWSAGKRFWYAGDPPLPPNRTPYDSCRSLKKAFVQLDDKSPQANMVLRVLKTAIAETSKDGELRTE
jgi:hypothetical protein